MIRSKKVLGAAAMAGLAMSSAAPATKLTARQAPAAHVAADVPEAEKPAEQALAAFVAYLTTIHTPREISRDGIEKGLSLRLISSDSGARYGSGMLGGGWRYFIEYYSGSKAVEPNIALQFVHEDDENADMSPICRVDAEQMRDVLKRSGYKEEPIKGQIGDFRGWQYIRDNILINIVPQEIFGSGGKSRICIRSIRTMG